MNYEEDVAIDESSLDQEWLDQPSLMMKYGRYRAGLQRDLDIAEENIKLIRSNLIKKANENPDKYLGQGIKPTGPVVEAYYRNSVKHKEAKKKYIELQYEVNLAWIATNSIDARKIALENLVKLHGQQYFAGPRVPNDITRPRKKKRNQAEADRGVGEKMKRKRRNA